MIKVDNKRQGLIIQIKVIQNKQRQSSIKQVMKQNSEEDLQISQFIKDPTSLKLLILAGTNIRITQLNTISKCTSLIKLDLSSNSLSEIPLKFHNFHNLKILYLHDNLIQDFTIAKTTIQYVSLFANPIKDYRHLLIDSNEKLIAIDHNVITKSQRLFRTTPPKCSQIKWPIVEISQNLEQEEDYLNLLKAQIFVINQIYKKTVFSENINLYIKGFLEVKQYMRRRNQIKDQFFFKKDFALKAAKKWIEFTRKRKKLRQFLAKQGKEYLMFNRLEEKRSHRSKEAGKVLDNFTLSVKERMKARIILERNYIGFKAFIPVQKIMMELYLQKSQSKSKVLYFKESEYYNLEKIFLYAKRILFKRKQYDLCDYFDKLVKRTGKAYYMFKLNKNQSSSNQSRKIFLKSLISETMPMILSLVGVDRKHFLYNKKGHKQIQIKSIDKKMNKTEFQIFKAEKLMPIDNRIQNLYQSYETIIEFQFKNDELFTMIIKLLRYFNAGNFATILSNQTAYFQTEIAPEKEKTKRHEHIYIGIQFFVKRVHSANIIQRFWRRVQAKKQSAIQIIPIIRTNRANKLICRWARNLIFQHRIIFNKWLSFTKNRWRDTEIFLHLDIYMNIPEPTDFLRFKYSEAYKRSILPSKQHFYQLIHKQTEIEIIQMYGRKWVKVKFQSAKGSFNCQRQLAILTYRYYYNGFFIKLFTLKEVQNNREDIQKYETKIEYLFKIKIQLQKHSIQAIANTPLQPLSKRIQIDNLNPYFIWIDMEEAIETIFKGEEIKVLTLSIFIYNKNKRPLKVNCDLLWAIPSSIYYYRKKQPKNQIRITPIKEKSKEKLSDATLLQQYNLPHIRHKMEKERRNSMHQHHSLLHSNRKKTLSNKLDISLISETLNIRRK